MAGKIELKAPLDGVVTIEPEDTASNFTVTIPAVTSTLVNEDSDIEAQVKTATNATGDAPIYACRAWVNFNGTGTVAIRASGNVSSITDNGTGDYTVNFTTAMPDADYSVSCGRNDFSQSLGFSVRYANYLNSTITSSSFKIITGFINTNGTGVAEDGTHVFAAIFR